MQNNALYNKAMEVAEKVEQGAETAGKIAGDIQNRLN